jgi:DNA-binding transcriptional LysR family regulator
MPKPETYRIAQPGDVMVTPPVARVAKDAGPRASADLGQLRSMAVFARTVQTGSFRGAAKALGLSPSVVSHHVSQLESDLDVVLLYRTTRRLSLTPEGERLYAAAQEMLSAAESGLQQLAMSSRDLSGRLTVAAPAVVAEPDLRAGRLVEVLPEWTLEAPAVYAVWPANARRSGLGLRLVSFLEERLRAA